MTAVAGRVDMATMGQMVRERYEQTAEQLRNICEQTAAVVEDQELGTGDAADVGS